jgi:hypothetical protein
VRTVGRAAVRQQVESKVRGVVVDGIYHGRTNVRISTLARTVNRRTSWSRWFSRSFVMRSWATEASPGHSGDSVSTSSVRNILTRFRRRRIKSFCKAKAANAIVIFACEKCDGAAIENEPFCHQSTRRTDVYPAYLVAVQSFLQIVRMDDATVLWELHGGTVFRHCCGFFCCKPPWTCFARCRTAIKRTLIQHHGMLNARRSADSKDIQCGDYCCCELEDGSYSLPQARTNEKLDAWNLQKQEGSPPDS